MSKIPAKILVTGVESTGKSDMVKYLSAEFNCPSTREFAREYLSELPGDYTRGDLDEILEGQCNLEKRALEEAVSGDCNAVICDTGPEVLFIWSEHKYAKVSGAIKKAVKELDYDLVLLTDIDLNWVADEQRETPDIEEREILFLRYKEFFNDLGVEYRIISGVGKSRFERAKRVVEIYLNKKSSQQC